MSKWFKQDNATGKLKMKISAIICIVFLMLSASLLAQETVDVGATGWEIKKPVMAGTCETGCPWGELGNFVKESMKPLGYSVIICRNCNRTYGPRLVSEHDFPPALDEANLHDDVTTRVNAPC